MVLETYIPSVNHKKLKGWVVGEELTKVWPGDGVLTTTHILVSGIFRQRTTFIVVLDVVTKFSKIGSVFFFR